MADPVRNIIIKLGSKTHSPEVAFKHIQTLLQFAMKKKLKLDPLLRDEILVTVLTNYPEFYANWSEEDATELLMMVSEASDEVSPISIPEPSDGNRAGAFLRHFAQRALESAEVSRRQAESQPLYLEATEKETRHRLEILRNRSNNSDSPIEISPDNLDDSATPSCVPVNTESLSTLISEKPPMNVDPSSLPLSESDCVKNDVLHVSDEKEKLSDEPNNLSLIVFSSDNIVLPSTEIAVDPKEICPADAPSNLPTNVESVDLSSPHKFEKTGGIPLYTATSLGESLEHVRHFAGLPSASIPQPYRVIHPSESSSEDDKILAEVYGHSVTLVQSPTKETRRSRRKNVPVKVIAEIGDDNADTDQPEKKWKSSETQKGSVAAQPPVVPASSTRKVKPATRVRGRSITPEVQAAESSDTSIYRPQFVSPSAQAKWSTMVRRELIVQRSVDENQMNSVCDVLPLLREVGLLKTVTAICPYSKLLTYEFYCNLNEEMDNLSGEHPLQIFIRGKCSQLTSKYVILHRLALHNWLPSAHFHTVGKPLASLLFRIGTKMSFDLGSWIYSHILTLIHPREQKGLEPMTSEVISPTLLYMVDQRLLIGEHICDVTPVTAPSNPETDTVGDNSPHARDLQLSIQLKTRARIARVREAICAWTEKIECNKIYSSTKENGGESMTSKGEGQYYHIITLKEG
ncbi:PREDICTED: uncharacterized protein LOC109156679 [Ipomoea nil]|uniref:uncharacterized protein LOC109156679 n=1 Tax=Ipomoea nil TaxID=35883 RepID=UPI000901AE76|nr:PREDICTED: uncharacterized protein LOC109156679 [Ipomoea nil]